MGSANERQVGGTHYQGAGIAHQCRNCGFHDHISLQHWDLVSIFHWDYFQAQIIKYVMRWEDKNGRQDLEKAKHFLDKYIELDDIGPTTAYVNQD